MKLLRKTLLGERWARAQSSLVAVLLFSLLWVTPAGAAGLPAKMREGGACAGMKCERGCCADTACCGVVEQGKAPSAALGSKAQDALPLARLEPRVWAALFSLQPDERYLVKRDEPSGRYRVPPLRTSGVWLI